MVPRLAAFIRDLHRRRVLRVGAIYLVAAWLVIQVAATVFPLLRLPEWSPALVVGLLIAGFPVAIALAWAFDLGPDGISRTLAAAPVQVLPEAPAAPPPAEHSIAILPFLDLSKERDHEYLADGIAEEILLLLAQTPGLRVAARTSAFAFRGRNIDVREIGRQLGVTAVLEGSVRASGDQLRVSAQLVDVRDGYPRWSRRFDRTIADVFAVQDEIAAEITAALEARSPGRASSQTANLEAYEYYLRGRQQFHLKTARSWQAAEGLFRRALEADPRYAPAHAGHADTCAFLHMYHDGSEKTLRCADESSLRALELGPGVPEAHVSRGLALSLRKRYREAALEFERALALNPRSFEASYFHGRTLWAEGDLEGAAAQFRRAAQIQPESYETWGLLGTLLLGLGRTEEALQVQAASLEAVERVLALTPDDARALYFGAGALLHRGERERACEWAERAVTLEPDDAGVHYNVACFYAQAGLDDRALRHLERAVELGFAHRDWIAHDPDLSRLRPDPRFAAALARTGQVR